VLTVEEVQAVLKTCNLRYPTGVRDRALLGLMYRAALRVSEALDLAPGDVDHDRKLIRVMHGKGDKARVVVTTDDSLALLDAWLRVRPDYARPGSPLFCTLKGGRMDRNAVGRMLKRRAERAGITKRVHPHGLRHTAAAEWAVEGVPLPVIQAQLGHSNIATTSRYISHLTGQDQANALAGRGGELA
jgi:site-specific recombinase XerD